MRKLFISGLLIVGIIAGVDAASTRQGRGTAIATPSTSNATSGRSGGATVTRNATPQVAARSAIQQSQQRVATRAAATTQKVINSGIKVEGAAKNVTVNEECQNKYFGCMDSFCMLDNVNGGRCVCSNRNAELDDILAEIEALDQQSYQMATLGVEQIEMGDNADAAIAKANAVADETTVRSKTSRQLDLSLWDMPADLEEDYENIFESANLAQSNIYGKTGDALQRSVNDLCVAQMPECAADMSMLKLMYAQKIRSDCTAYENSLKQRKNESQNKLYTAQKALREAALEQLQNANKYDLGQCTVQFKKCMQTTGGCGDDFSGCASIVAMDNTNFNKSSSKSKSRKYSIKGKATSIEISASTYDALLSKKPLCENVTKSCVAVADKVWDTFLREVAPAVKSAELIAEDNARQSCIGNISQCFQKACKDNIDPNDPDGSYDMCLTRPESMLNLCKVPLNACGIDTSKNENAIKSSPIWEYVVARLASMRVDSCTKDVKECLQSEDRCGSDYSQCIGLDLDSVIEMCPTDKLVGCREGGNKKSLSEISDLVMGIFLNIDNTMLTQCQKAVTAKMLELCGDTATCVAFDDDNNIGTESLLSYKDNNGNYVIEGLVSFGNVKISDVSTTTDNDIKFGKYEIDISEYKSHLNDTGATAQRVVSSLQSVANKINQKIAILSQDSTIKMCVEGRDMSQIRKRDSEVDFTTGRYPHLLDSSILAVINSGIGRANTNYTNKYNQLVSEALESQGDEVKSILCAAMAASAPVCKTYKAEENGQAVCTEYEANGSFKNAFTATDKIGMSSGEGIYDTKYVISGADMSKLMTAQQSGHSEYVQTDSYGNMLGRVSMNAVYSASTNSCAITTESVMCKTAEAAITTDDKSCGSGGIQIAGGGVCSGGGLVSIGGGGKTNITQTYHGTVCSEFGEPVVTTSVVAM